MVCSRSICRGWRGWCALNKLREDTFVFKEMPSAAHTGTLKQPAGSQSGSLRGFIDWSPNLKITWKQVLLKLLDLFAVKCRAESTSPWDSRKSGRKDHKRDINKRVSSSYGRNMLYICEQALPTESRSRVSIATVRVRPAKVSLTGCGGSSCETRIYFSPFFQRLAAVCMHLFFTRTP